MSDLPQHIKDHCITEVDGYKVYWPTSIGSYTAANLRMIADYLDQQNADWDAQITEYFDGVDNQEETR